METKLKIEFQNLYGGDGNARYIDEEVEKLSRVKKKTVTHQDSDIPLDTSTGEVFTELVKKEVQTFAMEGKYPIMRFGGIHGKLWGHLRASGKAIADMKEDKEFPSKAFIDRMMQSINIIPVICVIKDFEEMKIADIPQITAGISQALIIQKFDYLPKCTIEVTLSYPEMHHSKVLKILKHAETTAGMNKRRATMKILNREIFK